MARGRKHRYRFPKFKLRPKTVASILSISLMAAGGLTGLTLFAPNEGVLGRLRQELYAFFGVGMVGLPIILLLSGLMFTRIKMAINHPHVVVGLIISWISVMAMMTPISLSGAGEVGNAFFVELAQFITNPGAFLVFLSLFFIGLVVLFNTSFDEVAVQAGNVGAQVGEVYRRTFGQLFSRKSPARFEDRQLKVREAGAQVAGPGPGVATTAVAPQALGNQVVANLPSQSGIWEFPPLSLLSEKAAAKADRGDLKHNASIIEKTLESFGVQARVVEVNCGPAVTQYALEIALGTKLSKITGLQNDLALALAAPTGTVRIEAPIPGKSLVGVEIPNRSLEIVSLKNVLMSQTMQQARSKLTVSLGLDVSGEPIVADIAKMPHVLIAGATGSGKSVMINAMIASLLFRASPQELKLIMIDPKRVEMTMYNGIPHLLTPVIVDLDKILSALKWAMAEMDRRYRLFASMGVRNIVGYNEASGFQALPYIVILVDELADLMMFAPVEVEDAITRLAQMARATGIHLVVSTQRPSVDVITGLIKANIPCRIAFNVSSMIDSRVIIDQPGAEKLLGRGDMLFVPPDIAKPIRVQGVFVSDGEVNNLITYLRSTGFDPEYTEEVTQMPTTRVGAGVHGSGGDGRDQLFVEAVRTVCQYDRASASLLQRRLRIGYARAARLIDELEAAGIIGPGEGAKPRDVLLRNAEEYLGSVGGGAEA